MKLRKYENDWLARVRHATSRRVLIVGPTGSGKTVVAARLMQEARARNERVLFVVHRRELVKQAVQRLRDVGVARSRIGVILGGVLIGDERQNLAERPSAPIQVASIQTLMKREETPEADVVFVDEAHRAPSKSYRKLLDGYEGARIYGLTATPFRLDGKPLSDLFDEIAQCSPSSELIASGFLAKPLVYTVPLSERPDLTGVLIDGSDFRLSALAEAVNRKSLVGSIVEHWHRHAGDRQAVCYAVNLDHAQHIASAFEAAGVRTEMLHGGTPTKSRVGMLARLAAGSTRVVVNCMVLTEGWDCPEAKLAIIARPTMSRGLWAQMVGRITRPDASGVTPIVLDHAGNALIHGLPLEDFEFPLDFEVKRRDRPGSTPEKTCPDCDNAVPLGVRACSFCAHEFWAGGVPEETSERLVLARSGALRCTYEHCPTPDVPLTPSKRGRGKTRKLRMMHFGCWEARSKAARVCQYEHCPTPEKLLHRKAEARGTTMHRGCLAASKDARDGFAPVCPKCGGPTKAGKKTPALMCTPCKGEKISKAMGGLWKTPAYRKAIEESGHRMGTSKPRICVHCGKPLTTRNAKRGRTKYHAECWSGLQHG